ncbi:hypothetical protein PTT_15517 [Pyrenophora teres f. teres 0-1]|uniref:Uncharacterized protein n=1 Tax=Pyrenophora teres f. teres (strain 0-1) TaxID=861557 RepID=E3S0E2_PYRTT|nr:hypothetical protein PTT_15517 [Pyrenophora teres f. teres 0-1]
MSQRGGTFNAPLQSEYPSSISEHTGRRIPTSPPLAKQSSTLSIFTIVANDTLTLIVVPDEESQTSLRNSNSEKEDDSEWTIIEKPIVDKPTHDDHTVASNISSQFKLDLGWGSWRTTVFSWDINIHKH